MQILDYCVLIPISIDFDEDGIKNIVVYADFIKKKIYFDENLVKDIEKFVELVSRLVFASSSVFVPNIPRI